MHPGRERSDGAPAQKVRGGADGVAAGLDEALLAARPFIPCIDDPRCRRQKRLDARLGEFEGPSQVGSLARVYALRPVVPHVLKELVAELSNLGTQVVRPKDPHSQVGQPLESPTGQLEAKRVGEGFLYLVGLVEYHQIVFPQHEPANV